MKLQQYRRTALSALLVSAAIGATTQAHALSISPATTPVWYSNTTPALNATDVATIVGSPVTLALVYKQDFGGGESGNAAGYYSTSFSYEPSTSDPSGATISWNGPLMAISCPTCYVVVKDGKHTPNQYLFTLNSWNGTDALNFSGFWPGPGSISHIAIFNNATSGGGTVAAIPEPETYAMLLAGLGLVGFAARRKLG